MKVEQHIRTVVILGQSITIDLTETLSQMSYPIWISIDRDKCMYAFSGEPIWTSLGWDGHGDVKGPHFVHTILCDAIIWDDANTEPKQTLTRLDAPCTKHIPLDFPLIELPSNPGMSLEEFNSLEPGCCMIHWINGGESEALISTTENNERRITCYNYVDVATMSGADFRLDLVKSIKRMGV